MREQPPPISTSGAKRRSTRICVTLPLLITGINRDEVCFAEKIETVSINCHGFHYFSGQFVPKNSTVYMQLILNNKDSAATSPTYRGRVAWIRKSSRLRGMYLVGVEFETPQNVWNVETFPEDWITFSPLLKENPVVFLAEVDRILHSLAVATHYQLLGVEPETPHSEVKHRFYQLARKFHPDHHMDHPDWTPRLLSLMESLATAYRTLSDAELRKEYNSHLAHSIEEAQVNPGKMAQGYLEKALECMAEKNFAGSILWLHRAIEYEPNRSNHRALLGHCLSSIPEYHREAVEQFEMALEMDPRNVSAHLHYGELLEQLRAPWKARFHYAQAVELDPHNREAVDRLNRLGAGMPRRAPRISLLGRLTRRR
ncbi:MAG TPA: DnaJ domain-containing protein [Candidatus Saccharimonadales bacterium]|nr:DnaJ domain-containing protein [Candidatus Saccharimonadales bacterium]